MNDLIVTKAGIQPYGTGADGAAVLDGTNTFSWASKASAVYTLTQHVNLTSLSITDGSELDTDGFFIWVQGNTTLNTTGKITNNGANGNDGSGATGGAAAGTGVRGGAAGSAGKTSGGAGTYASNLGTSGGTSFISRLLRVFGGGCGGGAGASYGTQDNSGNNGGSQGAPFGGAGGQGGDASGSGSANLGGGGGGEGGGSMAILSKTFSGTGTIEAKGGNGGAGQVDTLAKSGIGSSGGGGVVIIVTDIGTCPATLTLTAGTNSATGSTVNAVVGSIGKSLVLKPSQYYGL